MGERGEQWATLARALSGRYLIERELGHGGMGAVLLAHDIKHNRKVAIKVLRPEVAQSVNAERFKREIHIAAQLQHPNVLALIDSGDADGVAYFVMPLVQGESLRQRLVRERQLPIDEALRIALEVADALAYAHEQGVVHRDIKPENILLGGGGGHALVADFGIARALSSAGAKVTETGIAVGTPDYMSPEQASGAGDFDQRTDIYSLGCVAYEMLTGTPPYTGATPMAVIAKKALEPVPSMRVVRETIPEHVEHAIGKALAKVPADRFSTAREFASALRGDTRVRPKRLDMRRRWMLAGAAGTVVLLSVIYVLAAGVPFGSRESPPGNLRSTQFTSATGVESFPSISPDGKWIVYDGQQSGNRDVYLQSVTGQQAINLTADSPVDDYQPAFSSDGERIAFRSERDGGGIFVMGRTGEGVRRVTNRGYRPTWSNDGKRIAFVTENVELYPGNSEGVAQLWVVNLDDGAERRLERAVDPIFPAWSPHGTRIAYSRRLGVPAQGDLYTIAADGSDTVALTADRYRDWSPAWSADGRWLYYASDRGGSMNLWRIPVDERTGRSRGAPEPLTTPATYLGHPSVAGDGTIAYTSAQITINIQRIRFDPIAGTVVGDAEPVTSGTRQWSSPDPSPDGKFVAYYTLAQPEGDLYISRADGSAPRQLTSDTAIDRLPHWSPDGRTIAYFSSRAGPLNVWTIAADGSDSRRMTAERSAYNAWAPDSKRLAVGTGPDSGLSKVKIVDPWKPMAANVLETLPPWSDGVFLVNDWSPDGTRLVGQAGAVGDESRGIVTYTFATKRYEKLLGWGGWPVWLPDGKRILFVAHRHEFWVLDSRTKKARLVYENKRDVTGPPRLTRDGRFAFFSRRVTEGDVWVLGR